MVLAFAKPVAPPKTNSTLPITQKGTIPAVELGGRDLVYRLGQCGLAGAMVRAFVMPDAAMKTNSTIPFTLKVTTAGVEVHGWSARSEPTIMICMIFQDGAIGIVRLASDQRL
jgi:hypothetical protein